MDKNVYDYWLYGLSAIGKKTFLKLHDNGFDSKFLYECNIEQLPSFLSKRQMTSIIEGKSQNETFLKKQYENLKKQSIFMTVFGDADYPEKLSKIDDSPAVLFYKGRLPMSSEKTIAIIGARNCSEYGSYVAKEFASFFAKNKITVISGMARGIDGYAQTSALTENGFCIGVLGNGVNVCYPAENMELYRTLIKKGCVMSEYFPDEKPMANYFPPRNRIISGLADALLVVEAKEKSGTLITVEMALEQGKDVYVVPGRITDALSKGCNKLLQEGANPAVSPRAMLLDLYGESFLEKEKNGEKVLSKEQTSILSFLEFTPVHINVLHNRTRLPLEVLQRELLFMSVAGLVKQTMNGWYQRVD